MASLKNFVYQVKELGMEVSEDSLLAAVDKLLNTTECEARQGFDYTPCNLYLQVQEIRFY